MTSLAEFSSNDHKVQKHNSNTKAPTHGVLSGDPFKKDIIEIDVNRQDNYKQNDSRPQDRGSGVVYKGLFEVPHDWKSIVADPSGLASSPTSNIQHTPGSQRHRTANVRRTLRKANGNSSVDPAIDVAYETAQFG